MRTGLKVLFIGGTGVISTACVARAVEQGHDVYVLNRGQSGTGVPGGATVLQADIRDLDSVRRRLSGHSFDSVVDFVAFTPEHVRADIGLFRDRTRQYVFISSASAYQTPPRRLPLTESTPLHNPFLEYSRLKAAAERELLAAYRDSDFPVTIVRPSHTYSPARMPLDGRWTAVERMRQGKDVIVHGDGTSLWTLTHSRDFARLFTGLLGDPASLGEAVHITSDELLSWNQIYESVAEAAGTVATIVHVPSEAIFAADQTWGAALLGDKSHSVIFDNSKIHAMVPGERKFTPFDVGAGEIVAWHDEHPELRVVDPAMDSLMDVLAAQYRVT